VRDRVVQAVLCHVLEPIFERDFMEHSYGFRPNRGARTRCATAWTYLNRNENSNSGDKSP